MAEKKGLEKKVTFTLVVEYEELNEDTMESVKSLVAEARAWAEPVKAELTNVPASMSML